MFSVADREQWPFRVTFQPSRDQLGPVRLYRNESGFNSANQNLYKLEK
jgi:hypothetical protein